MKGKTESILDIRQSINYSRYLNSQSWIVERIKNTNYFIKKIPLFGSILKVQRPNKINFEIINYLQKRHKVFQTIIEPNLNEDIDSLLNNGYKLSKSPYLPSKTIHLNLNQTKNKIYANFSKDCRYSIRKGERLKIVNYSSLQKIKIFHNAWKNCVNFSRYVPSLKSLINLKTSFPNNTCIFLASHNKFSNIIGGAIFTISSHGKSNHISYYWYGFTNKEGRTSLSQYSLLYSGILWAKLHGCKVFDFEGIYDDRFPNKSWLGFTHFKKSFGGLEILYPGCYTKYRIPFFGK